MVNAKNDKVYMADHEAGPNYETELDNCVQCESVQEHIKPELDRERELEVEERQLEERRKNKKW